MEDLLQVGAIASTHGVKGEVKVYPMTDDVSRFKRIKELYMETPDNMVLLHVRSCKFFKGMPILQFEEYDNVDQVAPLQRYGLFVKREDAVRLKPGEYYVADMIGLQVYQEDGQYVGTLKDVMETGANDVYVVTTQDNREILLPAIRECISKIDMEQKRMDIIMMKGLDDA